MAPRDPRRLSKLPSIDSGARSTLWKTMVQCGRSAYIVAILGIPIGCISGMAVAVHRTHLVDWSPEILLWDEIGAWSYVLKSGVLGWGRKFVIYDIDNGVVRNEIVGSASYGNAYGLLNKTFLLKCVRINERADQGPFSLFAAGNCIWWMESWSCSRRWVSAVDTVTPWPVGFWFADTWRRLATLFRSPLLDFGKGSFELAVDKEVAQASTRAPLYAVRPTLYARKLFRIYDDVPAIDEAHSFTIEWTTNNEIESTS